jgi:diadenylate cyclase
MADPNNFLNKIIYLILNLKFLDLVDIVILTILLFFINLIIVKSKSFRLILGVIILITLYFLSNWLNLVLSKTFIQFLLPFIFIAISLIFQKEIRLFLEQLVNIFPKKKIYKNKIDVIIDQLIEAFRYFSQNKIGALIVFEKNISIDSLTHGGQFINSEINKDLLISIFSKSSPLHDGALIIKDDKIKFASKHLPLGENYQFTVKNGTRHRASIGITQISDALSITISEETGAISLSKNGKIKFNVSEKEIVEELKKYYQIEYNLKNLLINNFKILSLYIFIFALSFLVSSIFWLFANYNNLKIQKIIEVPIEFRNLKEDLALIDPSLDKIKVSLAGYDLNINSLNISQIKAIINLNEADEGNYTINISSDNLINIPKNIEIVQITPTVVKFKIIKKLQNENKDEVNQSEDKVKNIKN